MPYSPTTNTNINVVLSNDLSGTLDNPYVISVEHINQGILNISNGGLGTSSIPAGNLLIGNGTDSISTISGNQDDILTWSNASGSWVTKHIDIVEDINISSSQNNIFEILDLSVLKNKNFYISFLTHSPNLFLASPTSSSGGLIVRSIQQEDLPYYYENLSIINSNFSGTFVGQGQFNSISGDGSGLFNLTSSQVTDFEDRVIDLFTHKPHTFDQITVGTASVDTLTVDQLMFATGSFDGIFTGSFYGDGSNLENIQIDKIEDFYGYLYSAFTGSNGIVFSSGTISAPNLSYEFSASDNNIDINKVGQTYYFQLSESINAANINTSVLTASSIKTSNIEIENLSSSIIHTDIIFAETLSGTLYGTYSGSGAGITDIPNESLKFDYITINNNQVKLGESVQYAGISNVTSSGSNLIVDISSSTAFLQLTENPNFNNLYSNYIQSDSISSSIFIGDGFNITNLNFNNIGQANIDSLTSSLILTDEISANTAYIVYLTSSFLSGDGSEITNINVDNIPGLSFKLDRSVTGSTNITTATDQNSFINIYLKDHISLNSVTASFNGDGKGLTNLQSAIYKEYTANNVSAGDIVYLNSNNTVSKASNISSISSNIIGIVSSVSGTVAKVQINGESQVNNLINSASAGTILYLGTDGTGCIYSSIPINCYAVRVGTFINSSTVLIDIKKLWKIK